MDLLTILERDRHTVALVHVRLDRGAVAHILFSALEKDLLQVRAIDHACERQSAHLGGGLEVEACIPLVAHTILDPIRPRVGRELDGPSKAFELRGALKDGVCERRSLLCREVQVVCEREPTHASSSNEDVERSLQGDGIGAGRGGGELGGGRSGGSAEKRSAAGYWCDWTTER
eukprot:scaffold83666_cov33-Tisochrysis_lutea.AAC.1